MKKRQWNDRERLILKRILHAQRQPASGANWLFKEDGVAPELLYQLKSTEHRSITLQLDDLLILRTHAQALQKAPVFVLDFVGGPLLLCVGLSDIFRVAQALFQDGAISIKSLEESAQLTHDIDDLDHL